MFCSGCRIANDFAMICGALSPSRPSPGRRILEGCSAPKLLLLLLVCSCPCPATTDLQRQITFGSKQEAYRTCFSLPAGVTDDPALCRPHRVSDMSHVPFRRPVSVASARKRRPLRLFGPLMEVGYKVLLLSPLPSDSQHLAMNIGRHTVRSQNVCE